MTKADIVSQIAKETGIDKITVLKSVESFMDKVKESMANGDNVYLRGFGSFLLKRRAKKKARLIKENISIIVPAHNIVFFKPAKTLAEEVR